jgi:hypothetical protein
LAGATAAVKAWFVDQQQGNYAAALALENSSEKARNDTHAYSIAEAQPQYFHVSHQAASTTGSNRASIPIGFYSEDNDGVCRQFTGTIPVEWSGVRWEIEPLSLAGGGAPSSECD